MSARHRQAKKRMSEWAVLLPSLGESLRIASLLTACFSGSSAWCKQPFSFDGTSAKPRCAQCHVANVERRNDEYFCCECNRCFDMARYRKSIPESERPIQVGDYVRWERSADYWVEGDVTEAATNSVELIVRAHGRDWVGIVGDRRRQLASGKLKGRVSRVARPSHDTPPYESPIVVGDYVRWERGPSAPWNWVEGEVTCVESWGVEVCVHTKATERLDKIGHRTWLGPEVGDGCTIRRIPRPAVAHATFSHSTPPTPTAKNVYSEGLDLGGLSPIRCWMRWRENHADLEKKSEPRWSMTDDQISSAKRVWHRLRSVEHSAELRAKVAASDSERKAREVSVLCQGDYDDEEPWWPR